MKGGMERGVSRRVRDEEDNLRRRRRRRRRRMAREDLRGRGEAVRKRD